MEKTAAMSKQARREAIATYRERKPVSGIYAIKCSEGDRCWVGHAPDLATIGNREWFTLRGGSHPCRSLQQAWAEAGEAAFSLVELETIDPDNPPPALRQHLQRRKQFWCGELAATPL